MPVRAKLFRKTMKTMPEIVSEMTAIARKELRTKIQRSRAERKGPLLLGKSARQNGPVLPAVKISQLPLARTTCFGRRISVPSEAWEAYREACLKLRPKIFQKRLGQSTLLPTIIRWQVVWRNHPAPAISASPTPW